MKKNPLLIIITFDTDYDFYYTPKKKYSQTSMKEEMLSWSSLEDGIPIINENLRHFEDSEGREINFTWFLLSDKRQKEKFNDYTHIYKKYTNFWKDLTSRGDELGLHIHLIEKQKDLWVQSINDDDNIKTLEEIIKEWRKLIIIDSIRMGYCYNSNRIMKLLEEYNFKIDSSALPKRKMEERQYFDWLESPMFPFHPSKANYKVPAEDHYNILEVPFTIFQSKLEDDLNPVYRYINLSFHPHILGNVIKNIVKNYPIIHSISHFFEFIPRFNLDEKENLLIAFNKDALLRNLSNIIKACKEINRSYRFICISELLKYQNIIEN